MSSNLPSILPVSNNKVVSTGAVAHAQNLSVSELNYKKDIRNAKISIGDVTGEHKAPVTSIVHADDKEKKAVSSVAHIGEEIPVEDERERENADDRRYSYIRRLMQEKRRKEAVAAQAVATTNQPKSVYEKMKIKTAGAFRLGGRFGLRRQFFNLKKYNPAAFKNLSNEDQKYFLETVKKYAKSVAPGKGFDRQARRHMRYKMEMDRRKGIISKQDIEDFDRMIHNLPKAK